APVGGERSVSIDARATQMVQLRFAPNFGGIAHATLQVDFCGSNCGLGVPLTGDLRAPRIDVTPLRLDFGHLELMQSRELTMTVNNRGSAALTVDTQAFEPAGSVFTLLTALPVIVPPQQSSDLQLRFTPMGPGRAEAHLSLHSNDPHTPVAIVEVTGAT